MNYDEPVEKFLSRIRSMLESVDWEDETSGPNNDDLNRLSEISWPLEAKAEAGEPVGWLRDSDPGKPDQKRHYHDGKECPDFADSPYCSTPVPVYLRPAPAANTEGLLRKAVDILLDEWASSNVYRTEKLWGTKLAAYLDQLKQVAALRGEETRP